MKKIAMIAVMVAAGAAAVFGQTRDTHLLLEGVSGGELDSTEIAGLEFMREEEKLARDVYTQLYNVWNLPIFRNIARSEQQHMDMVGYLIDEYGLQDPIAVDEPGVFANAGLQEAYDALLQEGRSSIVAALNVGLTVEELDIADLLSRTDLTDNDDIRIVYENLLNGSRNHLDAFTRQIDRFEG